MGALTPPKAALRLALALLALAGTLHSASYKGSSRPTTPWRAYFQAHQDPARAPVFTRSGVALTQEGVDGFVLLMERVGANPETVESRPEALAEALRMAGIALAAESRTLRQRGEHSPSWGPLLTQFDAAAAFAKLTPDKGVSLSREHAAAIDTFSRLQGLDTKAIDRRLARVRAVWGGGAAAPFLLVEDKPKPAPQSAQLASPRRGQRFTLATLEKSPIFAGLVRNGSARLTPNAKTFAGGMALIILAPERPGVYHKIAYDNPEVEQSMQPNYAAIREAAILVKMRQRGIERGIPKVLGIGVNPDGMIWIELEGIADAYEAGSNRWRAWRAREKVTAMAEIALMLDSLHAAGWVHNDLKPANILVNDRREFMLTDFGITAVVGEESDFGTPDFFAPERGGRTPVSDVFSFGVTLDRLFNVQEGFAAAELEASGLGGLIKGMTKEDPAQRSPGDMDGVARELDRIRGTIPPGAARNVTQRPERLSNELFSGTYAESKPRYAQPIADKISSYLDYVSAAALQRALEAALAYGDGTDVQVVGQVVRDKLNVVITFTAKGYPDDPSARMDAELAGLYDPRIATGKRARARWSFNMPQATLNLDIPLLAPGELAALDKTARVPAPSR